MNKSLLLLIFLMGDFVEIYTQQQKDDTYFYASRILKGQQVEAGYIFNYSNTKGLTQGRINNEGNIALLDYEGGISTSSHLWNIDYGINERLSLGYDMEWQRDKINIDDRHVKLNSWITGPRLRFLVSENKKYSLIFQHKIGFHMDKDTNELRASPLLLSYDLIYTRLLGASNKWILVNQLSLLFIEKMKFESKVPFSIPYTLFIGYFLNTEFMFFEYCQLQAEFGEVVWAPKSYYRRRSSSNFGLGLQYRFASNMYFSLVYNHPITSYNFEGFKSLQIRLRFVSN